MVQTPSENLEIRTEAPALRFKRLTSTAKAPEKQHESDACFDLFADNKEVKETYIKMKTGIAVEIPKGYVGLIFPRSSITKRGLMLKNSVGVIDSGYRGEIEFRFTKIGKGQEYDLDERIGQLMLLPVPDFPLKEVKELSDSDRGAGGFGSTGK